MERLNLRAITFLRNSLFIAIILVEAIGIGRLAHGTSFGDSVLIGGTGPANSKAELEVKSTTKGVLLPRMSTTQQNAITSPTEGLLLYDNVLHQLSIYDGSAWQQMFDAGNLTGSIPSGSIPAPTVSTLGGVFSKATVSHNFLTGITSGTGAVTAAQPAFTDISGSVAAAQLPNPSASTLGGVESLAAVSHNFLTSISTSGVPTQAQPAFTDISGNIAVSQMNSGTGASSSTFWRGDGSWQTVTSGFSNPMTTLGDLIYEDATPTAVRLAGQTTSTKKYLSQTGTGTISAVPSWQQIAFGDLSGSVASTQMPALTGDVTTSAGTVATSVVKIQSVAVASTSPVGGQFLGFNGTSSQWEPKANASAGQNWITTGDAETNSTTGWIMYNDSAATPVDCTGGVVVGTPLTVVNTSPLSGTYSYLWTHGASNTQGTGFSYAFTLDTASATKVENTQFDMTVASGTWAPGTTSADGDQTVWIYDVDSSTLIQPTTFRIYSGNSGSFHFQTYWQPVNSTSRNYRLCVHNATTTATAYTTKFDSFSVAPSTYTYGTPVTDTTTFTPVLSASTTPPTLGASSVQQGSFRKNGDVLEVWEEIIFGTSGTSAGSGTYRLTLPNGYAVDTAKLSQASARAYGGTATIVSAGTVYDGIAVDVSGTTPGFVQLTRNNTIVTNASPGAWTANDYIKAHFTVPIVGWSSGVQMSDSAPQTTVAAAMTGGQIPTGTLGSSFNVAKFATVTSDSTGSYSASTGLFTASVPGYYFAAGQLEITWASGAVSTSVQCGIGVNGTVKTQMSAVSQATAVLRLTAPCFGLVNVNAGDTIGIYSKTDTTTPSYTANTTGSNFQVFRLGDNRTIGATETVAARYTTTVATSVANTSDTVIPFATKDYDYQSMCDGVNTCTAPYPGLYEARCTTSYASATYAAGNQIYNVIYKNGSAAQFGAVQMISGAATNGVGAYVSARLRLVTGDAITCHGANGRTAGATALNGTGTQNVFEITRVGN